MKFYHTIFLGLVLLISCNSKKNETEQVLNNKWSSLKQYDLDSNIYFMTYFNIFDTENENEMTTITKLYFDRNGLLKTLYKYLLVNDSVHYPYKTTFDYKFTQNGDIDEIICYKSKESDTNKLDFYFSNKFVYANDYVIVKSKQHPSETRQYKNSDGSVSNINGCQDYSKFELFDERYIGNKILNDNHSGLLSIEIFPLKRWAISYI